MKLSRRVLFSGVPAALLALTLPACKKGAQAKGAGEGLAGFLDGLEPAPIAEAYLRAFPKDKDIQKLLERLPKEKQGEEQLAYEARLRERIKADFKAGEVFQAKGWVLARAEGALATLTHLRQSKR